MRRLYARLALVLVPSLGVFALADAGVDAGVAAYRRGEYRAAAREFLAEAQRGVPRAQTILGIMYEYGEGVAQDDREAAKWYLLAAERGERNAQFNLAVMYAEGRGVGKDLAQAHYWYERAAALGHPRAREWRDGPPARGLTLPDITAGPRPGLATLRLAGRLTPRGILSLEAPAPAGPQSRAWRVPVRLRLDRRLAGPALD